ncbi:MAG TPA: mechanosensitive ion channel domain-containing protein [Burkholderiales bacterium]
MKSRWLNRALRCLLAAAVAAGCCAALAQGGPVPAPKPDDKAKAAAKPEPPRPEAVPLADAPRRAEDASNLLGDLREEAGDDSTARGVESDLRVLTREIDARLVDNRRAVARTSSIETLRRIEARWAPLRRNLAELARRLAARIERLDREAAQVDDAAATWAKTLEESRTEAPPEIVKRLEALAGEIARTRTTIGAQRARLLALQNRVATQDGRMADAIAAARRAREDLEENIFERDSPPLWAAASAGPSFAEEARRSLASQASAVEAYAERQSERMAAHALAFVALTAFLYWTRRRVRRWLKDEPRLADTGAIFDVPAATALLVTLAGGFRLYPDAPVLLYASMGALVLAPAVIILRRLIERGMYPVLYALVAFYVVDQVRLIAAPLQLAPRLIVFAEMVGAVVFSGWLLARSGPAARAAARDSPDQALRSGAILHWAGWAALALAIVSLAANMLGYVGLANLLGNALLATAYAAVMLYALVEIADGLFVMALHLPPFTLLGAVKRHRALISRRVLRFMQWAAAGLLVLFALDRLGLRDRLFKSAQEILIAESRWGAIRVSLADLLEFAVSVWAAFLLSRFVRFLLEEDVYTRFNMRRGMPYAISTMLNYVILIVGFLAGVAALGFDMTKFTILAGAFSIGVGFGLQNIFNNFVSGLILLFERPVKVGDVIQIEDSSGIVEHIGIRASTVRTTTGSEIIVPNGKLISERVVNWTFSSHERSIQLPIAVPIGTDLPSVIRVLQEVARQCEPIAKTPPPKAIVVRMGPDWLGLELHAWTERVDQWMEIRSDLAVAAAAALAQAKITVR